jgi:hypothetical protein
MDLAQYSSIACRIGFFGAFAFLAIAVVERLANEAGFTTFLAQVAEPGRMLEYAAVLLFFVIALLLRDIKQRLKPGDAA